MQRILKPKMSETELAEKLQSTHIDRLTQEQQTIQSSITGMDLTLNSLRERKATAVQSRDSTKNKLKKKKKNKKKNADLIENLTAEKKRINKEIIEITQQITRLSDTRMSEFSLSRRIAETIDQRLAEEREAVRVRKEADARLEAERQAAALPLQNASQTDDLPEYTQLITVIEAYEASNPDETVFIMAAYQLAETYRTDPDIDNSKKVLNAAKAVLEKNSPENRNAFLPMISENTQGKRNYFLIATGAIITFLAAATIAAGIALCASGILLELGLPLIVAGALLAAMGIPTLAIGFLPAGKAATLQNFHAEASPKSFGVFGNRIKPNYSKIQPETPSPAFN